MNKSGSFRINLDCLHLNLIISFVKKIFHLNLTFAVCRQPYKGIQDSLGFWIPRRVFRILGTGFQYLSVKLGFWILIVRAIPDSLSGIPDSRFHIQIFSGFRVPQAKKWGEVFRKHSSKSLY